MAEVEYSTTAKLSVHTIWDFVQEMDNWAPFLTGYQSHEKLSDTDSIWILKGDVGVLARTLKFKVHVSEWAGPSRVTFELEGMNEAMKGGGCFLMEPYEEESGVPSDPNPEAKRPNVFLRFLQALFRFLFRRVHGEVERGAAANAGPRKGMTRLSFRLRIDPEGPMAPMINALMKPAMQPAAENLANKIMAHLERQASASDEL